MTKIQIHYAIFQFHVSMYTFLSLFWSRVDNDDNMGYSNPMVCLNEFAHFIQIRAGTLIIIVTNYLTC